MHLFLSFVLICAMCLPAEAQQQNARSWSDLSQEVEPNWTLRMILPDSTLVEGRTATFTSEALTMRVVKTSNMSLHPKGVVTIPRDQVKTLEIRKNGTKGRWIGTLLPVAAGAAAGLAYGQSNSGDLLAPEAAAALFGLIAGGGGVAGYFIGRAVDRQFHAVAVRP